MRHAVVVRGEHGDFVHQVLLDDGGTVVQNHRARRGQPVADDPLERMIAPPQVLVHQLGLDGTVPL